MAIHIALTDIVCECSLSLSQVCQDVSRVVELPFAEDLAAMGDVELQNGLDLVRGLLESFQVDKAEELIRRLVAKALSKLPPQQQDLDAIRPVIEQFLPKRRKGLLVLLPDSFPAPTSPAVYILDDRLTSLARNVMADLDHLRDHQIFQWSTWYRDVFSSVFVEALALMRSGMPPVRVFDVVVPHVANHTEEIFAKGYAHQTSTLRASRAAALQKALAGLYEFLWIPLELLAESLPSAQSPGDARTARLLASRLLLAILRGFSSLTFGAEKGTQLLQRNEKHWLDCVPFLVPDDIRAFIASFADSDWKEALLRTFLPLAEAFEALSSRGGGSWMLPRDASFKRDSRRLEIRAFTSGPATSPYFLVHCYLEASHASSYIDESLSRGALLIVAPLRPDFRSKLARDPQRYAAVCDSSSTSVQDRIATLLVRHIDVLSGTDKTPVLGYNFAREFPLEDPSTRKFFMVARPSVQSLLKTLERETGVHLWCSVRRSGKTTASFDLGADSPNTIVIKQTMEHTSQQPGASRFAERFVNALESGRQLSPDFLVSAIADASDAPIPRGTRVVFVLDEYETLFERLRIASEEHEAMVHRVARPILNQMVQFSHENLIILVGQRPNAYHILMDQNQLSPYVKQSTFPLFAHVSGGRSELEALLQKALMGQVRFGHAFADRVYGETTGHPFLTIQMMIDLLDWLVDERIPIPGLELTPEVFEAFEARCLNPVAITERGRYGMFQAIVSDALGARRRARWLAACYESLRVIGLREAFEVPREEFHRWARVALGEANVVQFLNEAFVANFLVYDEKVVRPKIKLLARIAASAARIEEDA